MSIPQELYYTKDHEWLRKEGDEVVIGITRFAADQLGDVVFVELPQVEDTLQMGGTFGVVESVKAASDLFSPITGQVIATNPDLAEAPELVNEDPYGKGWMLRLKPEDPAQMDALLTAQAYTAWLETCSSFAVRFGQNLTL
ncbi:glycine cleavage system H protein [Magnetococcus marinus MC-1]|uniref:Glycine cleavage system H protein n=1 Tax=Magnetococcus marinus (strain ATCC BAA-1437 / JCM 17883 / MC-1) TaxID=156889 RepID=GCSH_MAGMM|nr:glycine cleavage system protein GcvH [Magnetococcus marinus]A0LDQ0.1 RecName: Full=Glycine cleavage system H protein [Magnetococcus marinus MC-1]ABK46093.1 glycine cleavage system H protein [Magnetococcus marinus MC-1]